MVRACIFLIDPVIFDGLGILSAIKWYESLQLPFNPTILDAHNLIFRFASLLGGDSDTVIDTFLPSEMRPQDWVVRWSQATRECGIFVGLPNFRN